MWEDSEDGDDNLQGAANCDPGYTGWILQAIHKIRSQKSRPSVDRICREVLRCHPLADVGEVQEQLELCVQDGKVHKVIHKGLPSYRDPGVFKPKDMITLIELAICASTCKEGSSFVTIEKYIKKSFPHKFGCDAFNSELRSQLSLAVRKGVTCGRLVTDGLMYRIAETSDSPTKDQNSDLRIAESKGPSPKKRKHVPRISESSAPLAKKRKTIVNSSDHGYICRPTTGSSKLSAKKGEHAQITVDNCVPSIKKGKKYTQMDKKPLKATNTSEGLQVNQSKYTKWILNTLCKIKKEKQRPCKARICREILKAHQDASVQEIKEHLDHCTQEGRVLKVSFKGKISYRISDRLSRDRKYKNKVCKQNFLQRLEAAITNLAEEGGSSLKSVKKYMGQSWNVSLLRVVAEEGMACGRLQKDGSVYRIARKSHKPSCVGEKLDGNVGMVTSIFRESKVDIHYSATTQDLSHLELLLPPRCKYCRRYFANMSRYLIHKRRHEQTIKPYWYRKPCKPQSSVKPYRATTKRECTRCQKIFLNLDQLNAHKCKRYWTKRVRCAKCGYSRVKHEKCQQLCKPCVRSLMAEGMTEHELSYLEGKLHKCNMCSRYFLDAEKLKEHEMIKHKRTCAVCGNARTLHKYTLLCEPCGKAQEEQGMTPSGMTERDLQVKAHKLCRRCNETFPSYYMLKKHEVISHRGKCAECSRLGIMHVKHPRLCKPCGNSVKTIEIRNHKCQMCNETFPTKYKLKKHEVISHLDMVGGHMGKCAECGRLGIMHVKHPLLCKPCGNSVKTIEIIIRNQEVEKKTCRCVTCNTWFSDSEKLKEHELIEHSIKTMIACVVCGNKSTRHEKHPQICNRCHDSVTTGTMTSKVVLAEKGPSDLQPNEPVIWIPITKCILCGQPTAKHKEHPHLCKKCNRPVNLMAAKHRPKIQEIIACEWCGERYPKHDEHPRLCKNCYELGITNQDLEKKRCKTCNKWFLHGEKLTEHELSEHGITCLVCGDRSTRHETHPQICKKCYKSVAGTTTSKVVLAEEHPNESDLQLNEPVIWIPIIKCVLCRQPTPKHKEHPHLCKKCNTSVIAAKHRPQEQEIIACEWCGEQNSKNDEHPRFKRIICKKCYELGITNQDLKKKRCKTCDKWFDREKLTEHNLSAHGITCLVCGDRSSRHERHPQRICKKCYKSL